MVIDCSHTIFTSRDTPGLSEQYIAIFSIVDHRCKKREIIFIKNIHAYLYRLELF